MILEMRKAYKEGYRFFGVRATHEKVEVGQKLKPSHDWDIENDCPSQELLSGTCAIFVDVENIQYEDAEWDADILESLHSAIERSKIYCGVQTVLVASKDNMDFGFDLKEVILENAVVLSIINET